ncbi:rab3 GTPase-activating protein non-catalytic subunit [Phlebotomus argentipes]|uniref:rab3 GTPase-activating protein non-catalytic subunit n=1 Tax=Phlebotomus argentipes TaxID=94469 RepID=UPI00289329E7|nr:rab3 GTPase-activating protein non-catalytic subunit [Phlebotomus argentipes]
MSCDLKPLARIVDYEQVQELLGFRSEESWLNAVHFSFSPTGEIMVFGHGAKLIFLSSRWDSDLGQNAFSICWTGDLEDPNDIVTSVLCLPVMALSTSSQSSADWTLICVGLSSGFVQFYLDFGALLYTQQFHTEPIQSIKAQSGKRSNEEIHISYTSCVCIVQGVHLFQILRTLRQQHFKNHTNSSDQLLETIPYRKWGYGGKSTAINDSVVVGSQMTCAFDHLLNTSLESGFYAKYRSTPAQNSLVLATGTKPYVGFHYAKEGFVQPVLADVARAVASKIKSALPGWLTGKQPSVAESQTPPPVPAESMFCRFGLCDIQRSASAVWLAPGNQLAAVADALGRIVIIDCRRGLAVRIFKGYRDAQCSFIEVVEKVPKSTALNPVKPRRAIFLVILAPRRGVLEIWPLQKGPKVAAFVASKHSQLLYSPHGLMGFTTGARPKYTSQTCLFLDPLDHSLKEITIPFHCALTDANSKTAKDLHLLKRLKATLRSRDKSDQFLTEISTICHTIQTVEFQLQCLDMMIGCKKLSPAILQLAVTAFLKPHEAEEEEAKGSNHHLMTMCQNYQKLLDFYEYLSNPDGVDTEQDDEEAKDEPEKISLSASELDTIQKLLDLATISSNCELSTPRVKFSDKDMTKNSFIDFLLIFSVSSPDGVSINTEKEDNFHEAGEAIFSSFLDRGMTLKHFAEVAEKSSVVSDDFMRLLLAFWLHKDFKYTRSDELFEDLTRFSSITRQLCALAGDRVNYQYNSLCVWWQNIREILLESPNAMRGLLAAIICRNIALQMNKDSPSDEENHWEQVSQETCQWTLLIGKLDDISILGTILRAPLKCENAVLPLVKYENPHISLKMIVNGGKGIIAELVAKWITASGIDVKLLLEEEEKGESSKKTFYSKQTPKCEDLLEKSEKPMDRSEPKEPVLTHLATLREHFPFSLQASVLLGQMAWEYLCFWSKNLVALNYLVAGLECLKCIPKRDWAIKHGLCCMIWNAHLKIPLEATKKLMNKAGRLPKEKLCLQDIGMSDAIVPEFLEHCSTFLDHFAESLENDKVDLKYEELLQEGPIPLTLLALQQNTGNPVLLALHRELNEVMHLIAFFNIKYHKPIQTLFDAMCNQAFFTEITRQLSDPLPPTNPIQRETRFEFLCRIVTASIDLIRVDARETYLVDHILWVMKAENLASKWQVDRNKLKKHQIVELYAHGWDNYAEQLLEDVTDTQDLGILLLEIAGRRMILFPKVLPINKQGTYGTQLADYLDSLYIKHTWPQIRQNVEDISFDRLVELCTKVFNCLSQKDSRELRIAGELFDACMTIRENGMIENH